MSNRSSHHLVGWPCERDNDCGTVQIRCDSGRCACYWAWALSGTQCDHLTNMSSWTLGHRASTTLAFSVMIIMVALETRRTWLVVSQWWLAVAYAFILTGIGLCQVENITAFLVVTSAQRWTLKQNVFIHNAFNGTGLGCIALGTLSLPMMWIDIGLATQRLRTMHMGLRVSRRILLAYILSYASAMVVATLTTPYYPQETYLAFGIFAAINTVVVVVVYTSGAWLLSSMLATSQRMRSVVLEHTLERSQTAATTLERSQTAANTLEREARSEADAPREHRLERASMLSI